MFKSFDIQKERNSFSCCVLILKETSFSYERTKNYFLRSLLALESERRSGEREGEGVEREKKAFTKTKFPFLSLSSKFMLSYS